MIFNQDDSLVLIIDIQEKLLNIAFNKELVEKKSKILSNAASILDLPVLITEQYPQGLGPTVDSINKNGNVYDKNSFNALAVDSLLLDIKKLNRKQIIIMGIETHICVYQTVVALIKEGFDVTVVCDACGSRSEQEHHCALSLLSQNGALIKTTEMILFELLKTAKHPKFKEIQALIK